MLRALFGPGLKQKTQMVGEMKLVGGLEHFLFSHILEMSSSQLTFRFFRWVETTNQLHSSSKLLRKDYGHAGGFLSLCIRSIYCHFLSGAAETCREVGSQIFFGVVAAMDLLKLAPSSIFARSLSLSLSFSLLSVRAMFIPELVQRRAKSLNQVVLLAAPNAMA